MTSWKKSISSLSAALALFLGAAFILQPAVAANGKQENKGGDFTLISADGPLSLKALRGKVVLVFFGYTACPSVCPISLSTMTHVFSKMTSSELKRTQALFISLDPERDTPEMLQQYTGFFHPNIVGLTEHPEKIARIARQYGVRFEKKVLTGSALGYGIAHSADIFVVDPQGKLHSSFPHDVDPKPLLTQIRRLLNTGG